jgi:hypothetical protein
VTRTTAKIIANANGNLYRLNQDVYLFLEDGLAQLLDFRRGQFYGLDAIATLMVSVVLEKGVEEAVTEIVQNYDATEAQVRSDLMVLLENLAQKKLVVKQEKNCLPPSRRSSGALRERPHSLFLSGMGKIGLKILKTFSSIFRRLFNPQSHPNPLTVDLLLSLSWLSFRLLGWSRTLSLWQQWHRHIEVSDAAKGEEMVQTVDKIVREAAASKLFLPMVCKERALVGYHLLRAFYGLPATLTVGIDRYPFQVHAWVECNGAIVTDDAAHCQPFMPLLRYS